MTLLIRFTDEVRSPIRLFLQLRYASAHIKALKS